METRKKLLLDILELCKFKDTYLLGVSLLKKHFNIPDGLICDTWDDYPFFIYLTNSEIENLAVEIVKEFSEYKMYESKVYTKEKLKFIQISQHIND